MQATPQLLRPDESNMLSSRGPGAWTREEVLEELNRILDSQLFLKSERLSCFLRTAVSYLLEGKADRFKEYTVGTEVYKRSASYDPAQDSIVRTEARRLRSKLKQYYSTAPASCPFMILMTTGSYVPVIHLGRVPACELPLDSDMYMPTRVHGGIPSIGVLPFSARSIDLLAQHHACNLEDEVTHELSQVSGLNVFRTPPSLDSNPPEQSRFWNRSGVELLLQGHLNHSSHGIVAQIWLTRMTGMILWSGRFDCDTLAGQGGAISAEVLAAVLRSIPQNEAGGPRPAAA